MWKDVIVAVGVFFTLFFPFTLFYLSHHAFPLKPIIWYGTSMFLFTQPPNLKSLPYASISLSPHRLFTKSYLFCLVKSNLFAPFILLLQVSPISQLFLATFQTGLCFKSLHPHSPNTDPSPILAFLISWFYRIAPFKWIFIAFRIQFWLHSLGSGIWPLIQLILLPWWCLHPLL